jgi:hypothetical protein
VDGKVSRLDRHGAADLRYSNGGVARVIEPYGVVARAFAVAPDGTVVMVAGVPHQAALWTEGPWRMALYRLRPTWDEYEGNANVVEYFNARFGHYFVTPLASEQQALDGGSDWLRTGRSFRAWAFADQAADLRGMCRFYSHAMFLPKSAHFHTHLDAECQALRAQGRWSYEGTTFAVRPAGGSGDARACPFATVPLYRAYNNGQGGAPNHRYTTDVGLLDQMVTQGWTAEGEGASRVFACVAAR